MVNYGIAIELHKLSDLGEADLKRIEQAVSLTVGRALQIAEQKNPVGPYTVHVSLSNKQMGHDEEGVVHVTPPSLHVIIEAKGEALVLFGGKAKDA